MTDTVLAPRDSPASPTSGHARLRTGSSSGHIAGLDGLRAVAVVAVILYHAGVTWVPGGLLGVDVFFVISGFLITALLLEEKARTGRIGLRSFWGRRIRRLAPALVLMLLCVSVIWGLVLKEDVLSLRRDVLFALGYGANWWFAFSGQGYFQSLAAPSPVLHTWSLAVEEQFYLLWPLAVMALMARGRRVARWAAAGAIAAGVATLAQTLAGAGTDRLYYGTDTRAAPLLVGAALGAWYAGRERRPVGSSAAVILQLAGLLAAAGVVWAFATVDGRSPTLYRGGFLALAVAVGAVIASIALVPKGGLSRVLSVTGLRYLGVISYGLYLWHWPLFLLVNHARTGLSGAGLLAVRLTLTLAVASASYAFLELPIRRRKLRLPHPRLSIPIGVVALVGVLVAATPVRAPSANVLPTEAQAAPRPQEQVGSRLSREAGVGTSRVLFVGDSVALTLANALSLSEQPYRVHIDNVATIGCGIARDGDLRGQGGVLKALPVCAHWPEHYAQEVALDRPDLVALLVGRWEMYDQFRNGRWEHVGEPDFDAYLSSALDRAIGILSATGARVALLTPPCMAAHEAPDGSRYPETDPTRVARFGQLLAAAQARHPRQSTLVDFGKMVCPNGTYTAQLDGVTIRDSDGVHFPFGTALAPVAERLLPRLRQLAVAAKLNG